MEEIQPIEEQESEEENEKNDHTLVTFDVGELLAILRAVHAKVVPLEPGQKR